MLAALLAEDVVFVLRQFGWREPSHVLDQSEDGHIHLLVAVHVDTLAGISQRHLLRGRYDDGTRDGQGLKQGQVDVTGSRRCVEDKIIEFAPVCIGNELFQGTGSHTATPERSSGG